MAMKHYRFADISFTLDARYPWLEEQCREYEAEPVLKASHCGYRRRDRQRKCI